jgi:hypothetical protein
MKRFTRAPPHCAYLMARFYDMSFFFFGRPRSSHNGETANLLIHAGFITCSG